MQSYQLSTVVVIITIKPIDDLDNGLSNLIVNTYTKTEVDTTLYNNDASIAFIADNFYEENEIDSTLSAHTNSTQLHIDVYTRSKTHLLLNTYTTTTQL